MVNVGDDDYISNFHSAVQNFMKIWKPYYTIFFLDFLLKNIFFPATLVLMKKLLLVEILVLILLIVVYLHFVNIKPKKTVNLYPQQTISYLPSNPIDNFINQFVKPPTLDVQITTGSVVASIVSAVKQIINPLPKKSFYTIAIFGDSMVQTMGESLPYLQKELTKKYPQIKFQLYNFGVGSENIGQGLDRFPKTFQSLRPDILIIGSFAYNPYYPYDREKYVYNLTQLLTKAKEITPNTYLFVEIAPLKRGFGQGNQGVNWPADLAYEHATQIIAHLAGAKEIAGVLQIPVIDVFSKTWINKELEGNKKYVNTSDGIHPSVAGHQLTAETIVSSLNFD